MSQWPDGWTETAIAVYPGCTVLQHATYGYVTIDWSRRTWCLGQGTPRTPKGWDVMAGKRWRERLVLLATEQAELVWEPPAAAQEEAGKP